MSLLRVQNLTTCFDTREGTLTAVSDLSFTLDAGRTLAIVGESGSGKSVACYSLLGLLPSPPARIVSGSALYGGQDLLKMSARQLRRVRGSEMGLVFQDAMTALNPNMTVARQLMEPLQVHAGMGRGEARKRAQAALEEVGINEAAQRLDSYPFEFSGGMRQRVMIAMALITRPKLLIADEPTTALDVTVQAQILALLKDLQQRHNLAMIFVSHDLAVVANIADHVLVMQTGKVVEQGGVEQVFVDAQHPYTQKLLQAIPGSAKPLDKRVNPQAECCVRVEQLCKSFGGQSHWFSRRSSAKILAVEPTSFDIRKGEILGLVGESGSGKSTLGRCIVRLIQSDGGRVSLFGQELTRLSERQLRDARTGFQMIFQDPYASLNPRMTVFDALAEPLKIHGLARGTELLQRVHKLMDEVGLSRRMVRKYPHEFSGGQRQRIAIARALAVNPHFIVADEPVSALDVTIQAQILELLMELSHRHQLTLLFISHDLAVVRYLADRVAVMYRGRLVELADTETLFAQPQHPYTQKLLAAIPSFKQNSAQDL